MGQLGRRGLLPLEPHPPESLRSNSNRINESMTASPWNPRTSRLFTRKVGVPRTESWLARSVSETTRWRVSDASMQCEKRPRSVTPASLPKSAHGLLKKRFRSQKS